MKVLRHLSAAGAPTRPRVAAVGLFDGVHLGHRRTAQRVVELARTRQGEAWIVIEPDADAETARLTPARQQIELFGAIGVDVVAFVRPTGGAEALQRAHVGVLVSAEPAPVSPGLALDRVALVEVDGAAVTSAAVRAALGQADLDRVRRLLGRVPTVGGRVVHGFHRGAPLGIPTANLRVRGACLPPDGVYAVRALCGGTWRDGVANIGFNPTFGNRVRSVETHVLDFAGDLYGTRLEIGFIARLRGEQRFADVQALLAQIHVDIAAARARLAADV